MRRPLILFLAVVSALFGSVVLVVSLDTGDGKPRSVTVTVGGKQVVADADRQMEPGEQRQVSGPEQDLVDETPPGVGRGESLEALVTPGGIGPPLAPTGAQGYTCLANLVANRSARAPGTRVSMFVLHFTVSRPGSLAAIHHLFDTPAAGVSSSLGLELDGQCELWVPFTQKPWTQGAFNSVSESVEIVTNDLTRPQWLAAPIIRDGTLAAIVADRLRVRGLPPRLVDPVGCTPRAGYTDHNRLECGNNHVDVGNGFPWDVFGRQVRADYYGTTGRVTAAQKVACRKLTWWRRTREGGQARRNAVARRKVLARRGVVCDRRGARRA